MTRPHALLVRLDPDRYYPLLPAAKREVVLELPEQQVGDYRIEHWLAKAEFPMKMHGRGGFVRYDAPVIIRKLLYKDTLWMSDSPSELEDMHLLASELTGNVLIGGLGMGLLVALADQREQVKHITVVEIAEDVIALTKDFLPNKVEVVCADFEQYLDELQPGSFDSVAMDIWPTIDIDNLSPMLELASTVQGKIGKHTRVQIWSLDLIVEMVQEDCRGYECPSDTAHQLRTLDLEELACWVEDNCPDEDYGDPYESDYADNPWTDYNDEAIREAFEHVYSLTL